LSSGSRGPRPKTSSRISSMSFSRSPSVMGSDSSRMSLSTTAPTSPRTLSLFQVAELIGGQRIDELVMDQTLDFEPAVGPRSGPNEAAATQDRLRVRWRSGSSFRPWPCPQTREDAVEVGRVCAVGHKTGVPG